MSQLDTISVDGETADWAHDIESSVAGDASKKRRYNYAKCAACREQKKKCEPVDRVWPEKCKRCIDLDLGCSKPEDIRTKSGNTSHPLRPNTEHTRIIKHPTPKRPKSLASASLIRSPEGLILRSPTILPPSSDTPCEFCQQLELSRSRFMVPSRSWKSSVNSTASRFTSPGTSGDAKPPGQRVHLGSLSDVQGRAKFNGCNFCHLVWLAAEDQLSLATKQRFELDLSISVHAKWEIDGRELIHPDKDTCFFQPVTRHIRLSWEPSGWLKDAYILLSGDDLKLPGFDLSFLGRTVQSAESLERIKGWVEDCNDRHEHCSPMPSARLSEDAHLRVIDLEDYKLVPLTVSMEYVVLSYAWDPPAELFLKSDYKEDWLKENQNRLPQTTKKAMKLTRDLGIRYLWVDSLCIIQDMKGDKQANYSAIEAILASAFLTICAATGTANTEISQHIRACSERISLMVHHPVETHIQSSQWSKGAWTCQDRLLSGRCLIFTTSGVWFQCQEESMSEDTFEPSFQGRSADWVQSPAQIWSELAQQNSQFRAYIKCVESYTSRQLPREGHALRAFAGISNFLGSQMETRFFSGLPNSYFDAAILWTPATGESSPREQNGQLVAPSWSWAGWTGQVTYRPPILTGAVENIRDWLMAHTWISWYLVDRNSAILGEIGTFARADLPDVADAREKRGKEAGTRFSLTIRPPYKDSKERWPSRKRSEFSKKVPTSQQDRMDTDGPQEAPSHFLQFWTWSAFLRLGASFDAVGSRIRRYNILDRNDDICGSIVLPDKFANMVDNEPNGQAFQFIATSDARIFFEEEMPEWTYYIPKERHDSSWDLWYVMLLETDKDGVSRRVSVGKVFKDAFHQSFSPGRDWREFILA
ncbi:heterokaryon incompatibility protein-domain-containing protein [Podospora didyma]|uniref:Heterokaryon incompatibility protein-domain-containing protein n=1 Tax=Podospora didyma TaxID=330526 RepID=A0AAE0P5Z3_9PEZI|nr:heterokaryon incompatibility protein-domain-containing protein [Podospora didyma]